MAKCLKCLVPIGLFDVDLNGSGLCGKCREKAALKRAQEAESQRAKQNLSSHLEKVGENHLKIQCVTLQQLPGHQILDTRGIVSGVAVMGANIFKDISAAITDITGGRSKAYESTFKEGRLIATSEMQLEALSVGANAVLGVTVDYETVNDKMMLVTVSGTAVVSKPMEIGE